MMSSQRFLKEERRIANRRLAKLSSVRRAYEKRVGEVEREFREQTAKLQQLLRDPDAWLPHDGPDH